MRIDRRRILTFLIVAISFISSMSADSFKVSGSKFMLNDKPFVIKAAELHYPRIPKSYWEHRIKMCKALGMNTICLYVFWNVHEPYPDKYDFTGDNDLAEFIRLCAENDMYVILRPGPYVCAEWEMGGLPWWLLQKENIRLRESDPYFLERVEKFQNALAEELKGITIADGGPIIMIQVENEYGSYGIDKEYVATIRDILRRNFSDEITMFQCDWSTNFINNALPDLLWTLNFGTGADIDSEFQPLREVRPDSPLMCSEYWSGWFDEWGKAHETRSADDMIAGISKMLTDSISFSLYMTHGGTNFGHWAGANSPGYVPHVTSYDYDAPISESGAATPKYFLLRELMKRFSDVDSLPEIPESIQMITVPEFHFTSYAPLFKNLPPSRKYKYIPTMEQTGQGFGSLLYSAKLPLTIDSLSLKVEGVHDFANIFIDGIPVGTIDRRINEKESVIKIPSVSKGSKLDILVEATGRINFGCAINDFKGITGKVFAEDIELSEWEVACIPDEYEFYNAMKFEPLPQNFSGNIPGVYKAEFMIETVGDTFLDFTSWGKGLVYLNGHPLGRIWNIGPQQTLYAPGCWLKEGRNELMVFDILGPEIPVSEGHIKPIISVHHRAQCEW